MKFFATLTLFAASVGLSVASDLPTGLYEGSTLANGTWLLKPAGAPDSALFTIDPTEAQDEQVVARSPPSTRGSARVAKRATGCFGSALSHAGTDRAVNSLKAWAGSGNWLFSSTTNRWLGYQSEGALVYYCITAPNSGGNLDTKDVNYALERMDAACPRYTASYFRWDGSVEIVGKARVGDNICV